MPQIEIDQQSCRGCELCVDECPTEVFGYDEKKNLPIISKKEDCIECLTCYYICPSAAIEFEDINISKTLYRDLSIQEKLGKFLLEQEPYLEDEKNKDSYKQAFQDMFVRIQAMSDVYQYIAGKSLPAIGTSAGMVMSQHFPSIKPIKGIEDALKELQDALDPTWVFSYKLKGSDLQIKMEDCFIREVYNFSKQPLGGNLCVLFGGYMMGYLYSRMSWRFKIEKLEPGNSCTYFIKMFEK